MIARRLVEDARSAGLSLEVDGADLIVEADRNPPPALVAELRQHKAAVIAFLSPHLSGAHSEPFEDVSVSRSETLIEPTLLLRDGRSLWRFRADAIPEHASGTTVKLVEKAQWHGVVLVADGLELIVVRPWLGLLSYEMLEDLQQNSGEVIALVRRQSRSRCAGREQVFEPTYRNRTDEQ
jgi:hypothetical protein